MRQKKPTGVIAGIAFLVAAAIMILLMIVQHFAPFGQNSLACFDANIDYIDFFAFLKDVLSGKNSPIYSFSKGLGGNMIAVITSGYVSPLNLLVVFFQKEDLHSFFDIVVALKIALAALTMTVFLKVRFRDRLRDSFVLLLALSYAFGQYSIAQASNIFWLDGVYMLPLMILGIWKIIIDQKATLLILSVAYTVLANWYGAAMNCLFAVAWGIFELAWLACKQRVSVRQMAKKIALCAFGGGTGVLIAGIFLLPTICSLGKGNEGTLNFELFAHANVFTGNVISMITNYAWGSVSIETQVSLFCGCFVLLGCVLLFIDTCHTWKQKACAGGLLLFASMCYYWKPLYLVFSLFKEAKSFWFRYSYLGIFTLVVLAAFYYAKMDLSVRSRHFIPGICAGITAVILLFYKDTPGVELKWIYVTIGSFCITGMLVYTLLGKNGRGKSRKRMLSGILVIWTVFELCCNMSLLMKIYRYPDVDVNYAQYNVQQKEQLALLKNADTSTYRITQTRTRGTTSERLTATYDEPAQFNYWSLSAYTSSPDDVQRIFLDKVGYRMNEEDLYVVNTSILPVDSLLGIKYVLSDYQINGLEKQEELGSYNGKECYKNPFAFPMAFKAKMIQPVDQKENENPFEYQNRLFSELMGEDVQIFIPVKYERTKDKKKVVDYLLEVPEGEYALYGNLPWIDETSESITADGNFLTMYAKWLSPSVFYIPAEGKTVELSVRSGSYVSIEQEQFYAVDLAKLRTIAAYFQDRGAESSDIQNGKAAFTAVGEGDDMLVTSITYDPDWIIKLNGHVVSPTLIEDCLMAIPLEKGENLITMQYRASGITEGILLSCLGIILLILYLLVSNLISKKGDKNNETKKVVPVKE